MLATRLRQLPRHRLPDGTVVMEATTALSRLLGLAGLDRRDIPPRHGLLLRRCRSVHTFGMRFDLDLIFLSPAGQVIAVERGVPPSRIRARRDAAAVLERPSGS
jgi:uncharacterized protein